MPSIGLVILEIDLESWQRFVKNFKIIKFSYHIQNHHEKCIKISTNMPSIGSVIPEIALKSWEMFLKKIFGIW